MARVLILTDRAPDESEWKGAVIWQTILALAETQHEVLVVTPLPLETIPLTHPRLTVTRPVNSWNASQILKLSRSILTFMPNVIHSFAFKPQPRFSALTVWPLLQPFVTAIPRVQVYSTFFEESDILERDAASGWHKSAHRFAVFGRAQDVSAKLPDGAEIIPLPLELMTLPEIPDGEPALLIPAPVEAWVDPDLAFRRITDLLRHEPDLVLRIFGGWGEYPLSARKKVWAALGPLAARIEMRESARFGDFAREIANARGLWCEPLAPRSWRARLSMRMARQMGKSVRGLDWDGFELEAGSIANALSRLYSST